MTGFNSKRKVTQDKMEDDDIQTYQRPWVGLTDGEAIKTFNAVCNGKPFQIARILEFAQAIEAALRSKNHD